MAWLVRWMFQTKQTIVVDRGDGSFVCNDVHEPDFILVSQEGTEFPVHRRLILPTIGPYHLHETTLHSAQDLNIIIAHHRNLPRGYRCLLAYRTADLSPCCPSEMTSSLVRAGMFICDNWSGLMPAQRD